jgi:hypothetical protein
MKMTSTVLLAAAMLLNIIAAPLPAQDAQAPLEKSEEKATPARPDSVRIDNTGIHVGGEDPVDINVPNFGGPSGFLGSLLPIISVLAVFGMPVAIVGFALYFKHRRNRMLHETLRAMVEKGVPIPPELMAGGGVATTTSPSVARRGNNDLRAGLVLMGVGGGLFLVAGKVGFISLFIGLALILSWFITTKTRNNQTPQ